MKGFNHSAWPERAHAELGNGPLLPWPPDTAAQHWHCCATSTGTLQLSVPAQLGTSCHCPGSVGLPRESSLSPHRDCSAEHPAQGCAPAAQTANRDRAPSTAPSNGNLGPKPEGRKQCCLGAGDCSKEGSTLQGQTCFPPRSLQLFLRACSPHSCSRSRAGQSLQKAQQLPKRLPISSSGGLIPRLESNQSLTQGRESPFI